jgi:hypothetical protein
MDSFVSNMINEKLAEQEAEQQEEYQQQPQAQARAPAQQQRAQPQARAQAQQQRPSQEEHYEAAPDPLLNQIKLPCVNAYVGAPKSGKSWAIKHQVVSLLLQKKLQFGMVITGTKFNGAFDFITNQNMVIAGYDEAILKKYLRKLKEYRIANGNKPASAFLILDDMLGQIPWETGIIIHMLSNYRHYGLSIFIATQYIYKISPTTRTVADYVFIWGQDNKRSYDAIYDSFGLMFEDYNDFKRTLDAITEVEFQCMIYRKDKRKKEERYGYYKAPDDIPEVKFDFSGEKKQNKT